MGLCHLQKKRYLRKYVLLLREIILFSSHMAMNLFIRTKKNQTSIFIFFAGWLWGTMTFVFAGAFQSNLPNGYAWNRYAMSAWGLEYGDFTLYNPFREPLYSLLLSGIGETIGYVSAGMWISSLSMLITLFATGWFVRRLANDWAAAISMILLPCAASTLSSTQWINHYPLQSAAFAVAVAVIVELEFRKSNRFLLLAALILGFCFAVDVRIWMLFPFFLIILFLCHKRLSMMCMLLAIVFCGTPSRVIENSTDVPENRRLSFDEKRLHQQSVVRRWQGFLNDPHVEKYCIPLPQEQLVEPAVLLHPCARATLWHNIRSIYPKHVSASAWSGLALLLLFLPPYRREDRLRLCTLFCIGAPLGVWASWTHFPDRYMLIPLSVWQALVPIALYRFCSQHLPFKKSFPIIAGLFLLSQIDKTQDLRQQQTSLQKNERLQAAQIFVQTIHNNRAPLRDCTDINLEAAFLPQKPQKESCSDWIDKKTGKRWVIIKNKEKDMLNNQWSILSQHSKYLLAYHSD